MKAPRMLAAAVLAPCTLTAAAGYRRSSSPTGDRPAPRCSEPVRLLLEGSRGLAAIRDISARI